MTDLLGETVDPLGVLEANGRRWPGQLADLSDTIADVLAERTRPVPLSSRRMAAMVVHRLAEEYGGTSFYWPKVDSLSRTLRDLAIWSDFDGTIDGPHGILALSHRYNLSTMRIYQILKVERTRHKADFQMTLPLETDIDKPF